MNEKMNEKMIEEMERELAELKMELNSVNEQRETLTNIQSEFGQEKAAQKLTMV